MMPDHDDGYLYNGEQVRFRSVSPQALTVRDRLRNALTAFKTDRPDYGRSSGYYIDPLTQNYRFTGWGWNKDSYRAIDYSKEVGPLENSSLVAAILNWTATQLPEAKPTVYTTDAEGNWEALPKHPAAELIRRPNPFHTWANYAGGLSFSWWISGNVYFRKVRDEGGQLIELWYLPDFTVQPRWPNDGKNPEVPTSGKNKATNKFLSHYQFNVPGKDPQMVLASEIVHLRRFVNLNNPRLGIGAFDSVVAEIYGDNQAGNFAATILRNMGIVVPLLTPKDKDVSIDKTQREALEERWVQKTTGQNIGRPIINSIPLEVTKVAFNPTELDLKALRLVPESRVAAVTGIPAIVLQFLVGLQHGHYGAAYEAARKQGYEQVIIPIQTDIAEQLSHQLLYEFADEADALGFDTTEVRVLQDDEDALVKRSAEALRAGGITLNQFLQDTGKPDIGELGNIYYVPASASPMTIERVSALANGKVEPPKKPEPDAEAIEKMLDLDRLLHSLEDQMRDFQLPK